MFGKRGVIQTDATKRNSQTPFRDPGAMIGLLTGVSFIGGVGAERWPWPTPPIPASRLGARGDPALLHREFPLGSNQRYRPADLDRLARPVHRLGGEAGRAVRQGSRALRRRRRRRRARRRMLATSGLCTLALSGRWGRTKRAPPGWPEEPRRPAARFTASASGC